MDCSQFESGFLAFREGKLSDDLRRAFELHLAACDSCSRLLSEFNHLDAIIEREKATDPNPYAATRILQRLENELSRPHKQITRRWISILQPAAIAVALLTGILIGSYNANKDNPVSQLAHTPGNVEFLRSNLFISEITDEDNILVLNK